MSDEYHQAWWGAWWPWAEANQGLLSVLALTAALAVAIIEQRRANRADEAQASALVRAEERSREERAAADERSLRETREADRRVRRAEATSELRRLKATRAGVLGLVSVAATSAMAERTRLEGLAPAKYEALNYAFIQSIKQTRESVDTLLAVLPAEADILLCVRRIIDALDRVVRVGPNATVRTDSLSLVNDLLVGLEQESTVLFTLLDLFSQNWEAEA